MEIAKRPFEGAETTKESGLPDFEPLLRKGAAAPKNETRLEKLKKALKNELFGLAKEVGRVPKNDGMSELLILRIYPKRG